MRTRRLLLTASALALGAAALLPGPVSAAAAAGQQPGPCAPAAEAVHFSDALDKVAPGGTQVGGLSSIAYDPVRRLWASAVDNNGTDPSRIWFYRSLVDPRVVGPPLVLRRADGTAYTGMTADDEGLAILPDGRLVVSSETEPSIRIFGADGVQQSSLRVPARFAVAPAGQATANATLEGLTLTPSGDRLVASMEGTLSGDDRAGDPGDATYRRLLVYDRTSSEHWRLVKQVGYRVQPGNRIPEVAAYDDSSLIVEEAAYTPAAGNSVELYAVTGLDDAPDVTGVRDLAVAPASDVVGKTLLADLVTCPTLGATAKEHQTNPLLDNYEGMAVTAPAGHGWTPVTLISDDNFSATQTTRLLNLFLRLP